MITPDLNAFQRCRILVVGDLMMDEYLWGETDRISPEAPVPIVAVKREEFTLGGAGNVVNNLAALGATAFTVGVIGDGENGQLLLREFERIGADVAGVIIEPGRYTTRKTRIIASGQHVLRVDRETIKEISEATCRQLLDYTSRIIAEVQVVLISDYGKGLLTRPLLSGLIALACAHHKPVVVDPKGLDFSKYAGASILTPNQKEAALAAGQPIPDEASLFKVGYRIIETSGAENLLITCGPDGMALFEQGHPPLKIAAESRQVYDVTGAGDTVVSLLGLGLAIGLNYADAAKIANTAAGIVVGKVGAATVAPDELAEALTHRADPVFRKHKSAESLKRIIADLKRRGKKIIMTNGCFDLLHTGHIRLFNASKQLGDALIVAIDDDQSVTRLKGPGRPVIGQKERVGLLCALDSIDYVTVFSTDNLKGLIESLRPDILTKGGNYASEQVLGKETVEAYGGQVALLPVVEDTSSTDIIRQIKQA